MKVSRKPTGYFTLEIIPKESELKEYYSKKYYQNGKGSYEKEYTKSELEYFLNKQKYLHYCLKKIHGCDIKYKYFLDIGCGEGWTLNYFKKIGCKVKGVDISSFGIEKFNPKVKQFFICDDIYQFIQNEIKTSNRYDIINLTNVIEHVLEPEELLINLKKIISNNGIIIVTFPNDFSKIQKLLIELKKIKDKYWIVSPDHISYFTKDSFKTMVESLGFDIELIFADFPIEIFLLNNHSNYIRDKTKGKQAHFSRVYTMNLLSDIDFVSSAEAFLNLGFMGFGRNLTAFMRISKE